METIKQCRPAFKAYRYLSIGKKKGRKFLPNSTHPVSHECKYMLLSRVRNTPRIGQSDRPRKSQLHCAVYRLRDRHHSSRGVRSGHCGGRGISELHGSYGNDVPARRWVYSASGHLYPLMYAYHVHKISSIHVPSVLLGLRTVIR